MSLLTQLQQEWDENGSKRISEIRQRYNHLTDELVDAEMSEDDMLIHLTMVAITGMLLDIHQIMHTIPKDRMVKEDHAELILALARVVSITPGYDMESRVRAIRYLMLSDDEEIGRNAQFRDKSFKVRRMKDSQTGKEG